VAQPLEVTDRLPAEQQRQRKVDRHGMCWRVTEG